MAEATSPFTAAQLKEKLRRRNLPQTGLKSELITRLMEADPEGRWMTANDSEEEEEHNENQLLSERQRNELLQQELELMRRERDVAQREAELARREPALASPENPANVLRRNTQQQADNVPNQLRADVKGIGELLGEFDGSNRYYEDWERQVRLVKGLFTVDDAIMKIIISSKLKGKAERWFRSRPEYTEMALDELLTAMKDGFDQRPSKMDLRKFELRTWQTTESFNNYYHEKLILSNLVPIEEADLLDCLVYGIPDQTLRNQARMQNFTNVKDLLNGFRKISLINRCKKDAAQGERQTAEKTTDKLKSETKGLRISVKEENSEKPIRCYNCNKVGHISKDCSKPPRERGSCYHCGERGHVVKNCPQKETKEPKETKEMKEKPQVSNVYEDPADEDSVEHRKNVTYEIKDSDLRRMLCLDTLLDTGSPISFVKERFIEKHGLLPLDSTDRDYCGCKKVQLDFLGKVYATISIGDISRENLRIYVVPEDTSVTPALLGRDILRKFGIRLTLPTDDCAWREMLNINLIGNENSLVDDLQINSAIPYEAKTELKQIFKELYVDYPRPREPKTKTELHLRLDNSQPFYCTPRKLAYDEKAKLQRNGKVRICVDFRVLNKATARDNYPMPLIEDQLAIVGNKKYYTVLDLKDGFHHVQVAKESVKYTSFVTPLGQYEWLRMPFGLRTEPATFQRYINLILTEFTRAGDMAIYMDDILIATQTIDHHLEILERVFKTISENLLELRIEKCYFLQTEVEYLGYIVSEKGIKPTRSGIDAVQISDSQKHTRRA
ncbi:PREDICTED: uncharacterized protein LOC107188311 [Dufourea novaeangliae]|uniref:uncharacterized protein LOC107188311 n=1 Tax=Dufourea novaeangliae TaxID=178035 RepID=UPI000766F1D5|nr:PREDICTED: uncharacterized protein LOC107188311 [Dufourea novaeangliae]